MFFYLTKVTMWLLHVLFPILSLPLHLALMALWAVSIHTQTGPDTIDPERANHGAPWYITKNCNIMEDKTIRGYCMQAKSAFAVSVVMLYVSPCYSTLSNTSMTDQPCSAIMVAHIILALWSLYPTPEARLAHEAKLAEKRAQKEKWESSPYDNEMTADEQWQHMWELQQLPRTPGTATSFRTPMTPMTPRTKAFSALDGAVQGYYGGDVKGVGAQGQYVQGQYVQHSSPIQERDEWVYDGKGKGTAM